MSNPTRKQEMMNEERGVNKGKTIKYRYSWLETGKLEILFDRFNFCRVHYRTELTVMI